MVNYTQTDDQIVYTVDSIWRKSKLKRKKNKEPLLQCRVVKWSSILSAVHSILIKSLTAMVDVLRFFWACSFEIRLIEQCQYKFLAMVCASFCSLNASHTKWFYPIICVFSSWKISIMRIYLANKINHVIVISSLLLWWFKTKKKKKRENSMRSIMTL